MVSPGIVVIVCRLQPAAAAGRLQSISGAHSLFLLLTPSLQGVDFPINLPAAYIPACLLLLGTNTCTFGFLIISEPTRCPSNKLLIRFHRAFVSYVACLLARPFDRVEFHLLISLDNKITRKSYSVLSVSFTWCVYLAFH